jgi:hypothetical protein
MYVALLYENPYTDIGAHCNLARSPYGFPDAKNLSTSSFPYTYISLTIARLINMKDKAWEFCKCMESIEPYYHPISQHHHNGHLNFPNALMAAREEAL